MWEINHIYIYFAIISQNTTSVDFNSCHVNYVVHQYRIAIPYLMSLMVRCTRNNNMKSLPLTCGMACRWFSPDSAVSSINKTDRHGITEILFKLALKTITLTISNTIGPLNKYLRVDNYKIASNSTSSIIG
jgi:hypothetical protein